ncbi:MAG: M28 family peptidase [Gemmatimonadaceae bacterium]
MHRIFLQSVASFLAASLLGSTATAQQPTAPHNQSITAPRMRADLMFLAGDGFRGRLTNTPENDLAMEWVKARFDWLELKPMGSGGSFFQPYQLMMSSLGEGSELALNWGEATSRHVTFSDFYPHRFSGTGRASGPVVFAGFGISAPKLGRDDLTGDVRGKVVLMLDHEPGENDPNSPFDGVVTSEYSSQLRKTLAAQEKGAIGVLFVADVQNHGGQENFEGAARGYWPEQAPHLERYQLAAWVQQVRIPAGQVSVQLAEQMLRGGGKSLEALARAAEPNARGALVALPGVTATLTANVTRHVVPDRNVVAAIEGSDARLKDEYVIIAAHVDHNGMDGDQLYAGADDDGSGTVALLAIAQAYAQAAADGQRPKRSVLFIAFNSEERGPLMGSWGYTENPVVPLDQTVAVLNMDMIGRNEEIPIGGSGRFRGYSVQSAESNKNSINLVGFSRSSGLTAAIDKANAAFGLTLKKEYDNITSQILRRSDQWPFLQRGVPAIWFHTGLHPDYHTIYDRPEKIEYAKMERIARLVHQASWDLANGEGRPVLDKR